MMYGSERGSLGVTSVTKNEKELIMVVLTHVEKRDKCEIRVKRNRRERDRSNKKWMEIIREDVRRECGIDENMVRNRVKWRGKIRVADPLSV